MKRTAWHIYQGEALDVLRSLPAESVQCVVTSPPYWGLRDYGTDGQLGLEATPEEYVERLVGVFREVRRVLREDGTCWLNLGDSYAANRSYQVTDQKWRDVGNTKASEVPPGLKPKDLVMIPAKVALALQADGWYLRSDIIWAKPNPMPESVRDRPTKAHEYVFLLTRSARYFYDDVAVREEDQGTDHPRTVLHRPEPSGGLMPEHRGIRTANGRMGAGRNRRSVWEITTRPYPDAHFAVFPPELPEVCIKAGTSEKGCCPECGAPWERVVEDSGVEDIRAKGSRFDAGKTAARDGGDRTQNGARTVKVATGWQPTCDHEAEPVPCTVLDPFSGAGTTGLVALRLGRSYIGIELNPEYVEMSRRRIATDSRTMPEDGWEPTHDDLPLFATNGNGLI